MLYNFPLSKPDGQKNYHVIFFKSFTRISNKKYALVSKPGRTNLDDEQAHVY